MDNQKFQHGQRIRVKKTNASGNPLESRLQQTQGVIRAYAGLRRTAPGLIPMGRHSYTVEINGKIHTLDEDWLEVI